MSLLFRHLRVHQIFGANTDVGKTILTTALAKSSAAQDKRVFYLKPVSTGPPQDADDGHIQRFTNAKNVKTECLYRFSEPVSPHLAVKMNTSSEANHATIPSDKTFVDSIAGYIRRCAAGDVLRPAHMYVETAGGVHSPTLLGTPQVDCYRPLFLPTVLIGDSKLGGISTTISSYEALLLRGYIIDAVMLFRDDYYRNYEYLIPYFEERGIKVTSLESPPPLTGQLAEDTQSTAAYYDRIAAAEVSDMVHHLDKLHSERLDELDSMADRTLSSIWWPFVQHGLVKGKEDVTTIDSASSDFFSIYKPSTSSSAPSSLLEPALDGSASWWTQALGHAHTNLTLAAAKASGRYGHVMFPQATHLPALNLAETLIKKGPGKGWASRAFFSDNGSTGIEVALKMALRAYTKKHGKSEDPSALGILGIKGSYHGDTLGAMDACEADGVFTCEWHQAKGYWFDPPTVSFQDGAPVITIPSCFGEEKVEAGTLGWIYDVETRLDTPLAEKYAEHIQKTLHTLGDRSIAALVLEPLTLGAGGMIFVDPLFQRVLIDIARVHGLAVIFDEVFVGLYRLGLETASPLLGVYPDISVHAKILTGGLVPLSVTLTTEDIFRTYLSENKSDALLHGHSYTAHAVGCEVANETLSIVQKLAISGAWSDAKKNWDDEVVWSFWNCEFVQALSKLDTVDEVMTLGCVLAIRLRDDKGGYLSHAGQKLQDLRVSPNDNQLSSAPGGAPFGIHYRTLGNMAYFMTSLNTSPETIRAVEDRVWSALNVH